MKFNLPAPSSVEWYRPGVAGGGQNDRIFNRLKAKLTGGKDDSGTSYFKLHDRSLSSGDADKIIANMKQDEDGYPMLQTSSTSGEAEREYQEWIIDRYLPRVEEPRVEELPIVTEVVETEPEPDVVLEAQKPEEPEPEEITVRVEIPKLRAPRRIRVRRRSGTLKRRKNKNSVQQQLRGPRRIRVPRRSGTIRRLKKSNLARPKKSNLALAMGAAWTRNLLDPLIQRIIKGDEEKPTKKSGRVLKKTRIPGTATQETPEIKSSAVASSKAPGKEDLYGFAFRKIGSSLNTAARARKQFVDGGGDLDDLEKRFFIKRALKSEFGGDFIRRKKGTFSTNPSDVEDPGLSKGERFKNLINAEISAILPKEKQLELFDQDQYEDKDNLNKILDYAKKTADKIKSLEPGFVNIEKNQERINKSFNTIRNNFSKIKNSASNTASNFKEFVDNKKKTIDIKNSLASFLQDASDKRKRAAAEDRAEGIRNASSTKDVEEVGQDFGNNKAKGGGIIDTIRSIDDFAGGPLKQIFRRGIGRSFTRFATKLGGRRAGKLARTATKFAGKITKPAVKLFQKGIAKVGGKVATKAGGGIIKSLGKKIPGLSIILGGLFSIDRFSRNDWLGGLGEIASGIAGSFPGPGTAISAGIDALLIGKDIMSDDGGSEESEETKLSSGGIITKLSSGGVVGGEAGPEAVISLQSKEGRDTTNKLKKSNPIAGIGPVISSLAGIAQIPIFGKIFAPIANPILGPLLSQFKVSPKIPDFGGFNPQKLQRSSTSARGKGQQLERTSQSKNAGPLAAIGNFFKGMGAGISNVGKSIAKLFGFGKKKKRRRGGGPNNRPSITGGGNVSGKWGPLLSLIASKESGGNYEALNPGTTLPGATKMTIAEVAREAERVGTSKGGTGAVGMYQQLPWFLVGRAKAAGLDPDKDLFSPANQDLIASKVNIVNRGGNKWLSGKISTEQFMDNLAYEWAALPKSDGSFAYPGQSSSITPADVRGSLDSVKSGSSPTTAGPTPQHQGPVMPSAAPEEEKETNLQKPNEATSVVFGDRSLNDSDSNISPTATSTMNIASSPATSAPVAAMSSEVSSYIGESNSGSSGGTVVVPVASPAQSQPSIGGSSMIVSYIKKSQISDIYSLNLSR